MNSTLVMKFGGASVASPDHFAQIAEIILKRALDYPRIIVVVSAMQGATDQLIRLAKQVHPNPPKREQDMLISVGERISISLLAMALSLKGKEAISFTGSQSGIITCTQHNEARILTVRPKRIESALNEGKIVIVAGFQGVSSQGEITTLGRGGSDTSAVALGVASKAQVIEFYKDVPGICNADPKVDPDFHIYPELSYTQALMICRGGAKVLHPRCIELAEKNNIYLHVRPFSDLAASGTWIGDLKVARGNELFYEIEEEAHV